MRSSILVLILSLLLAAPVSAEEVNAGFVQGLWYAHEEVFSGVPTRIYVALRNNTPHDLTGTVRFTDNGVRIGSAEVSALSGRLVEAWIDWKPTEGNHAINASLTDATLHIIGGGTQSVAVSEISVQDTLIIDTDTDKDGVGDKNDTDDDNDGVSDEDEKARGSNPRVANPTEKKVTETNADTPVIATRPADTELSSENERGLEQYIGEGVSDSLLSNVTQKVERAKTALDEYRTERNAQLTNVPTEPAQNEDGVTMLGTYTENATITRSQIEPSENFLSSFVSAIAALLANVWTFILWALSKALTHPALIQLALLLGILFGFYRIARRLGRRPGA